MDRRTNRAVGAALSAIILATCLTGCLNGRIGARCRTAELGQDRANVLVCRKGRWAKLLTKAQAAQFLLQQRAASAGSAAPVPSAPEGAATTPVPVGGQPTGPSTELVSVGNSGAISSSGGTMSGDGRFVAFLAPDGAAAGDVNGFSDAVVRDLATGTTTLVSVGMAGAPANGRTGEAVISRDGRFVAFQSQATNLTSASGAQPGSIYVRDLAAGVTVAAAVLPDGTPIEAFSPSISRDGRVVAFETSVKGLAPDDDPTQIGAVFARDIASATTIRVSATTAGVAANATAQMPAVSGDGRFVAFETKATNLVAGDGNAAADVFRRDLATGQTTLISVPYPGAPFAMPVGNDDSGIIGPFGFPTRLNISADGNLIAFLSDATDLVPGDGNSRHDVFVRDVAAGSTTRVALSDVYGGMGAMSSDGRFLIIQDDPMPSPKRAQVLDRATGQTTVVSITTGGLVASQDNSGNAVSDDGRFVLFTSSAPDVVPGLGSAVTPRVYRRNLAG